MQQINERVKSESVFIEQIKEQMSRVIVGQEYLVDRLLIGLLSNGHVLLEGVPGLAKTLSVSTLAKTIDAKFSRLQFTPDLLPADLIGTQIYDSKNASFMVKKGPIFANLVLADEINRAPAKVQSALLEAMQEKQVTIGEETFALDAPFLVLATQNPIEQEGTYALPEAQIDRFMLKLKISYPTKRDEQLILRKMAKINREDEVQSVVSLTQIMEARKLVDQIYIDEKLQDYIVDLVVASRDPEAYKIDIASYVE
ncbi:MAG: AAA family ATPase, partial [Candidatus Omnitrophica bacterium]|nr:AAA family ATPase [Candidatus Omnitrophota bacterium]